MGALLRYFGTLGFLQSEDWEPHTPVIQNTQVYASKFPLSDEIVWLFVNRGSTDTTGEQLKVAETDGYNFYDCYHGEILTPSSSMLSFDIEALGFGAVLQTTDSVTPGDSIRHI